jgi:hypothetical protein
MTAATGKMFSVGARSVTVFELDSTGLPKGTTAGSWYEGLTWSAFKAFELTKPNARRINHVGNDRLLALDFLPPLEGMAGTITTGADEFDVDALLLNTKKSTVGEGVYLVDGSDQQGFEPFVAIVCYQQAQSRVTKARNWRQWILPSTKCIPMPAGMGDNPTETKYEMGPSPVSTHIWGTAMSVSTDGATEGAVVRGQTVGKPVFLFSTGDGSEDEWPWPAAVAAALAADATLLTKIVIFVAGVKKTVTTDYTVNATKLDFETGKEPGLGAMVCAILEI